MAAIGIRPIRIEGNVAYVPLGRGHEAIIDADDAPLIGKRNWNALVLKTGRVYAVTKYKIAPGDWALAFMHRVVLIADGDRDVDHANGNALDCRLENLREATRSQNTFNARRRSDNKSGFKGVSFVRKRQRWRAEIKLRGLTQFLGEFDTPELAHKAYINAAAAFAGEFANAG